MSALLKYLPGKIKLSEDRILVYLIDLGLFDYEALLPVLSEDEKERAEQFKFKEKREQFGITRAILREVIAASLVETKAENIIFNYGEHGKPGVTHTHMGKQIEFNVAHSGHYAFIGITVVNQIGVDIEEMKPSTECKSLARRCFSDKEAAQFKELSGEAQREMFFRCWTRKEAFIKADGRGISIGLNKFGVSLDERINATPIEIDKGADVKGKWFSYQPVAIPHYHTAIAANSDKLRITAHVISN